MKKFGGPGKLKQKCMKRKCTVAPAKVSATAIVYYEDVIIYFLKECLKATTQGRQKLPSLTPSTSTVQMVCNIRSKLNNIIFVFMIRNQS